MVIEFPGVTPKMTPLFSKNIYYAHWGESDSRHRFQAYAKKLK